MSTDLHASNGTATVIVVPEFGYTDWSALLRVATPNVVELQPRTAQRSGDEWHVVFPVSGALIGARYELVIVDGEGQRADVRYGNIVAGTSALRVSLERAVEEAEAGGYVHDQLDPADQWVVVHGLESFPPVTIVDSSGRQVIGDVTYIDENTVQLDFGAPFGGRAFIGG